MKTLVAVAFGVILCASCNSSNDGDGDDDDSMMTTDAGGNNPTTDAGSNDDDGGDTPTGPGVGSCDVSDDLDAFIAEHMEDTDIPGLAAGIVSADGLLWANGYGFADIAANRQVTPDTIFAMMSISKVVTAAGVMQLVEEGDLDLDADVNTYLDDFDIDHPGSAAPITTRQLLTHMSGLAGDDYGVLQLNIRTNDADVQPLGEMLADLLVPTGDRYDGGSNYSDNEPGTVWTYSSIAISLAGFVAESIAGTGFDQLTDASIFQELDMDNTSWRLAPYDDRLDEVAVMYLPNDDGTYEVNPHFTFADYPAGSIRSSVTDFSRFLAAMINNGTFSGQTILQSSTAMTMREIQDDAVSTSQGIGWQYRSETIIGHGGDDAGASTDMWYDIETGRGAIMLMNVTRRPDTDTLLMRLLDEANDC